MEYEEEEQQDFFDGTGGRDRVMPPHFKDERDNNEVGVIRELSPKKVLEQVRRELKGEFYDYEEKKYKKVMGFEPLLNDKGIAKFIYALSSVVSDIVTFSSYSPEEIAQLVLLVCEKVIPVIHVNYKEYGIQEKSDLQLIDNKIFNLTLAAFKKAVGAGDRNVIGRTISENILNRAGGSINPLRNEGRQGFLQRINPFAR